MLPGTCVQESKQGPVVQSVVSLTSSLRVISLTVLADSIYNILILLLTFFFSKKFQHICVLLDVNFNESLTNGIVSFEQLGPGIHKFTKLGFLVSNCLKKVPAASSTPNANSLTVSRLAVFLVRWLEWMCFYARVTKWHVTDYPLIQCSFYIYISSNKSPIYFSF